MANVQQMEKDTEFSKIPSSSMCPFNLTSTLRGSMPFIYVSLLHTDTVMTAHDHHLAVFPILREQASLLTLASDIQLALIIGT